MNAKNYPQMAALVLAKCAAYDPYLTAPTKETCLAWAEQFELYGLGLDDLTKAVTKVYSDNGSGYRPLPKDITDAARAIRKERTERESSAQREAREDRLDARPALVDHRAEISRFANTFGAIQ
ncbi:MULTISPECIES: hypothetical protein [Mycobacteroides]|jgi:hypothetical protein|uniref:hypothetical protein n=1 Tax=Mycobacteroides TaxID=670516 RepID=UPI000992FA02|nr:MULTISPECIES: hypothetical protein [Mycobacteroides]MDB2211757.1 hypothetical protein [Mycobacteroides abscessus subsp. massiliense]MDB2235393.1 hypothetical protein [Mycobacteroides abscessus subsp. massiliense]WJJ55574.1 loader and inhibitor of phage [Mycobacterium phage prophiT36-2a]SKR76857.1 gp79 protein [Mycobacteroides abscessus subsp. abscessus]